MKEMLPKDLGEALDALADDQDLTLVLGKEVVERYVAVKKAETSMLDGMNASERKDWIIERY